MSKVRNYQVMLLPEMEIVERAFSLCEADAWSRAYNRVIQGEPSLAVIVEELPEQIA